MIDEEGFRPNVGIIIVNKEGRLLWARRVKQNAWQFPQGGIHENETPEEALYRELHEELGLEKSDVEQIACTRGWLEYRLPQRYLRPHIQPLCIGQKQRWYLLQLLSSDDKIRFDKSATPEFDRWRWVSYWYPLKQVVSFKRHVYRRALEEFAPFLEKVKQNS